MYPTLVLSSVLLSSLVLAACGTNSAPTSKNKDFATPAGVKNYFFACNATGKEPAKHNLLSCEDEPCISLSLSYQVSNDILAQGFDSCRIIVSSSADGMSADTEELGTYAFRGDQPAEINVLRAPDMAMLYGSGEIKVIYPKAGGYKFWLTRARQAVSISNAD